MLKHSNKLGLSAVLIALMMAGCASGEKKTSQTTKAQTHKGQAGVKGQTHDSGVQGAADEQVIQEKTEVLGELPAQIGEPSISTGQTTVPVRKRTTRTVLMQNQIPTVKTCQVKADVNRMNVDNFVAIGFSQEVAKNIVRERDQRGGFKSMNELTNVAGMDENLLRDLSQDLSISKPERRQQAGMEAIE